MGLCRIRSNCEIRLLQINIMLETLLKKYLRTGRESQFYKPFPILQIQWYINNGTSFFCCCCCCCCIVLNVGQHQHFLDSARYKTKTLLFFQFPSKRFFINRGTANPRVDLLQYKQMVRRRQLKSECEIERTSSTSLIFSRTFIIGMLNIAPTGEWSRVRGR